MTQISSINGNTAAKGTIAMILNSTHDDTKEWITAFIVPKLLKAVPSSRINRGDCAHLNQLPLADAQFHVPAGIDILLGAEFYARIIRNGICRRDNQLTAQRTTFGWIVFGANKGKQMNAISSRLIAIDNQELMNLLTRFWETENVPERHLCLPEEEECERIFLETTTRDEDGRYIVRIPVNKSESAIKDSRRLAVARLMQLERRFSREIETKAKYIAFMREYETLGHMQAVPEEQTNSATATYIPHHAAKGKKFRTVFDASCKAKDGVSLNDIQLNGERQQADLTTIVMRFRRYRIAMTADIAKMYRQVKVPPDQHDMQRILWREDSTKPIQEYRLLTQTYGMKSAAFCCVRALVQCARDYMHDHKAAAEMVLNSFYVDDMLGGHDTEAEAIHMHRELSVLLRKGGFELAKWTTNSPEVNAIINGNNQSSINLDKEATNAVLGLEWCHSSDTFQFRIQSLPASNQFTKRMILADIARLYDPLGYLSPVVITAKVLIQELWRLRIDWDEVVDEKISAQWRRFCSELKAIEQIRIPRWLGINNSHEERQLQVFADASELAYGVAIYVRTSSTSGVQTHLVLSKTRVAPIKKFTIPKLELSAALLAAKLLKETREAHNIAVQNCHLWTDSMVVLHWIHKCPAKLDTFTGNRVAAIQEASEGAKWRHVRTNANPADLCSRGIAPQAMVDNSLWWHGPKFLKEAESSWPNIAVNLSTEEKIIVDKTMKKDPIVSLSIRATTEPANVIMSNGITLLQRIGSFVRLMRVTAYVLRIEHNARARKTNGQKYWGELNKAEILRAETHWIKISQQRYFKHEKCILQTMKSVEKSSPLAKLVPFLDANGIIRLSGRIKRSEMPYDTVHPIVLAGACDVTKLLIKHAHGQTMHGGAQLCQQYLRAKYWILPARNAIKACVRQCSQCVRHRQQTMEQMMGDLPKERITPGRPFSHTTVDYAGPVGVRRHNGRTKITEKAYIALFVCMKTKAVHLELVSSLTTDAFIAAFARFVNRRGKVEILYSDNATTFHGAKSEMKTILTSWRHAASENMFRLHATKWKFYPPSGPHMAGLHERAVRSAKHHLRRVIGQQSMTFEQYSTLLVHVEACLNSRPIQALTEDASESVALTPAHFLIGEPIIAPMAKNYIDTTSNRLNQFKLLQKIGQNFWDRWAKEYATTLMRRNKWHRLQENLEVNDVVLIKAENTPPTMWPMGRVIHTYKGDDNQVRMADIKCANNTVTRPITKLILLPTKEEVADKDVQAKCRPAERGEDV